MFSINYHSLRTIPYQRKAECIYLMICYNAKCTRRTTSENVTSLKLPDGNILQNIA